MKKYFKNKSKLRRNRRYGRRKGGLTRKIKFGQGQIRPTRRLRQAYRMSNMIAEKKVFDQVVPGNTTGSKLSPNLWNPVYLFGNAAVTGAGSGPTGILQGTDRNQRIGDKIFARFIKLKTLFTSNTQQRGVLMRIVSAIPRQSGASTIPALPTPSMTVQWDTDQWTILWDRTYYLSSPYSTQTTTTPPAYQSFNACNSQLALDYKWKVFNTWQYPSPTSIFPQECIPYMFIYYNTGSNDLYFEYDLRITYTDV